MTQSHTLDSLPDFLQDDFHEMENRSVNGNGLSKKSLSPTLWMVLLVVTAMTATGVYFLLFNQSLISEPESSLKVSDHVQMTEPVKKQKILAKTVAPETRVVNQSPVLNNKTGSVSTAPVTTKTVVSSKPAAQETIQAATAMPTAAPASTFKMATSLQSFVTFKEGNDILSTESKVSIQKITSVAKLEKGVHLRGFSGRYAKKGSKLERLAFSRALAVKSFMVKDGLNPQNIRIYRNNNVRSYLPREEMIKNPARVEISLIKK